MQALVAVVQELSFAHDLASIMRIVRRAARELTGADGATFVLRDGDQCHYADEDAIAPLWKGSRFPMSSCISGWTMQHSEAVVIEDIYADARIPAAAYRPTFVKSMAMVPIRSARPVGALGIYWASRRQPLREEVALLQALADSTSIALENVQLYTGLESRVQERTAQLHTANQELDAFARTIAHDLRGPLTVIDSYTQLLSADKDAALGKRGTEFVGHIQAAVRRMAALIDHVLRLSRASTAPLAREPVDLTALGHSVAADLRLRFPSQVPCRFDIEAGMHVQGDTSLLRMVLENLLGNAVKYSGRQPSPRVELFSQAAEGGPVFVVRDNGVGFDMAEVERLFVAFERLPSGQDFQGTGIGLATVARIVRRHGGRIWAKSSPGAGATFYFTLP